MYTIAYPAGQFAAAKVFDEDQTKFLKQDVSAHIVRDEEDLSEVPGPVLIALYNAASDTPVTKFENKRVAARRVFPLLDRLVKTGATVTQRRAIFTSKVDLGEPSNREPIPAPEGEPVQKQKPAAEPTGDGSPAKGKRLGIGKRMAELIRAGKSTEEVLAVIHGEFPQSRAKASDVSIVRGKVNKGVL